MKKKLRKTITKLPHYIRKDIIEPIGSFLNGVIPIKEKKQKIEDLILITGSNSSHFKSSLNFLRSVGQFENLASTYYFDLGLKDDEINVLKSTYPQVTIKKFDYNLYPEYFNINVNAGEYAWKPVIINQIAKENPKSLIMWMDAGNLIHASLLKIRMQLKKVGFYSPFAPGLLIEWCHPDSYKYIFGDNKNFLYQSNLMGGAVAFNLEHKNAQLLLDDWANLALVKECFAPATSNKSNHRQDQSILTLLVCKYNFVNKTRSTLIGFSVHNDID